PFSMRKREEPLRVGPLSFAYEVSAMRGLKDPVNSKGDFCRPHQLPAQNRRELQLSLSPTPEKGKFGDRPLWAQIRPIASLLSKDGRLPDSSYDLFRLSALLRSYVA